MPLIDRDRSLRALVCGLDGRMGGAEVRSTKVNGEDVAVVMGGEAGRGEDSEKRRRCPDTRGEGGVMKWVSG